MVQLKQAVVASALLALGSAAPVEEKRAAPFTVTQVVKNTGVVRNGPAAYAKALAKYGAPQQKVSQVSQAAAASSVVATSQEGDEEYTSPVKIGSQTFTLDFDTGSSDLWVLGSSLSKNGGSHTYYSPGSTAKKQSGESWSISYGDGSSASGTVYTDTVTIGGTTVTGQIVEDATKASSEFTGSDSVDDGLVGLAFDSINTVSPNPAKTFFTNAINQGLPSAVFTAELKHEAPGTYTFGEIPASAYSGSIAYTSVDSSQGFWMFTPTSYSIGSGSAKRSSALEGIADTGTTLLLLDDSIVDAYYNQISSAQQSDGSYIFDCSENPPSFSITVAGYKATVPGSYINFAANGDGTCYGGIQSADGVGFNIFGDIFLKSQFVVFDRTQSTPRIGFAAQS